jgi:alkylation response protein AidB-like acyl-CoA dehydrogenase
VWTQRHEAATQKHAMDVTPLHRRGADTYTIFEGTSEIQRLVISRAISGVHVN